MMLTKTVLHPRIPLALARRQQRRALHASRPLFVVRESSSRRPGGTKSWMVSTPHPCIHCVRSLSSSGDNKARSSTAQTTNTGGSGNNWFIRIGWTLLGLLAIDQVLQFKQEREDAEKRIMLHQMQLEADAADANSTHEWDAHQPTLFTCRLLHVEPSLDGTKMLTRSRSVVQQRKEQTQQRKVSRQVLRKGDVVQVLESNVGPNGAYHLCRIPSDKDDEPFVGWYPVQFLEKVE